jgi:hypothetical protein
MCYNWCTCLLKYITMGTYCQSRFCADGSQPIRNVASTVLEFGLQLYVRFLEIRAKYYRNMRTNKYQESPKTNLGEPSL